MIVSIHKESQLNVLATMFCNLTIDIRKLILQTILKF